MNYLPSWWWNSKFESQNTARAVNVSNFFPFHQFTQSVNAKLQRAGVRQTLLLG